MKLLDYQPLIANLPVREQAFTTKRTTWKKAEKENTCLEKLNEQLFKQNQPFLTLNRQDVFDAENLKEKIIKTIYWGYPRGKRGNHFLNILKSFPDLEKQSSRLKQKAITSEEYIHLIEEFKKLQGLGLSTYTKLLYFLEVKIDDNPCLILDQRIINVIQQDTFSCLRDLKINSYNKEKMYPTYLKVMNRLATELRTHPENLEQFLFLFNNLKKIGSIQAY